jgi:hypothetical protein
VTVNLARIRKLKAMASDGRLEVEHVVEVAVSGSATDIPVLEDLVPSQDSAGVLVDWKLAAIQFLQGGCAALQRYAEQPSRIPFVVGILENVKTSASVSCLLGLSETFPDSGYRVAAALNLILSFDDRPSLPPSVAAHVRIYLEGLVRQADTEPHRAVAILALRGVGDASTLDLLKGQRAFDHPYQNTLRVTRKAIRRRLAIPPLLN